MRNEKLWPASRQWTLAVRQSQHNWPSRLPDAPRKRRVSGVQSFADLVLKVIADNTGNLEKEHIEDLPGHLVDRIWRASLSRGMSFKAWKLLGPTQHKSREKQSEASYRFVQEIDNPTDRLSVYIEPLTSPDVDFITHLCITDECQVTTGDLMLLPSIKNLGVLQLIQTDDKTRFPEINDRLIRGWCENPDSFPMLRVLRILTLNPNLTSMALETLSRLPALGWLELFVDKYVWKRSPQLEKSFGWHFINNHAFVGHQNTIPVENHASLGSLRPKRKALGKRDQALVERRDLWTLRKVAFDKAPGLLEVIGHNYKVAQGMSDMLFECFAGAIACPASSDDRQGVDKFAFWTYSMLGQICGNHEFAVNDVFCDEQPMFGPLVLPAIPMASLFLGRAPAPWRKAPLAIIDAGLRHWVFYRKAPGSSTAGEVNTDEEPVPTAKPSTFSKRKRDMADALGEFT